MQLSRRLMAVAKMVTPGNKIADVGTDHGYIPIYLVDQEIIPQAIAMDVNQGPLKRAVENITAHGITTAIETRLSDGVLALKAGEVDSVVIAGMGGNLVMRILSAGSDVLKTVKELILQPQSELTKLRYFLQDNGYKIVAEEMVYEDGKFYPMMKVIHGKMQLGRVIDFVYGPYLLENKNEILRQFLAKEKDILQKITTHITNLGTGNSSLREQELKEELAMNELAMQEF